MAVFINSDDFVFETEDSTQEPLRFNKHVLTALRIVEEENDGAVSCDPTPIGSSIQVVGQVPVTENTWHQDYSSILELLRPLSSHNQSRTVSEQEIPGLSTWFKSQQQQQQQPQHRPQRRSGNSPSIRSYDTDVAMAASSVPADMPASPSQEEPWLNITRPDQWDVRFQELADFRHRHGHSLVPHSHPESPSLSLWVKRQRYQYKLHREGKHSTMTKEREAALEQLGFVWDSHAATWDERFRELSTFQSDCGHCKVPTSFPPNPQLAVWVKSQRRQFKLFVSGRKSYMTQARRFQLSNLGFVFNPRKRKEGMEPN
jgi:hypothetical protein